MFLKVDSTYTPVFVYFFEIIEIENGKEQELDDAK